MIVVGCHVSGFGIIRSLGPKECSIVALHYDRYADFAQVSRHVNAHAEVPDPRTHEKEFIDYLLTNSHEWRGALILETNDEVAVALSKNKSKLIKHYRIVTPDWHILRNFIDKSRTYELARKLGIHCPRTLAGKSPHDLTRPGDDIGYPCLLKPVMGHRFSNDFGVKLFKVDSFDDLVDKYSLCQAAGHEVMIQELIPGPVSNLYNYHVYINSLGNVSARFMRVKVRQLPSGFGVTRVGVSRARIPEVEQAAEDLLKAVGFKGMATVEFKEDMRDGRYKLLEVNARLIKSNWLPTYCGVNFPWTICRDLVDHEQLEIDDYRKNVHWIELAEDMFSLVFRRNEENVSLRGYLQPYRSRARTFGDVSLTDPMPFVKRTLNLARKYCGL